MNTQSLTRWPESPPPSTRGRNKAGLSGIHLNSCCSQNKDRSDSKKPVKSREGAGSSRAEVLARECRDVSRKRKVRFGCRIVLVINWENKGSSEDAHILILDFE